VRRRRTKGAWFPTIGTALGQADQTYSGRAFAVNVNTGVINTAVTPLTFDVPFEGDFVSPGVDSLSDILGSGYLLRRVVGRVFAARVSGLDPASNVDDNPAILFGAGLLVARANDANSGGGVDTPIGSATAAEIRDNYSPLAHDTIMEPWIWRRTWVLGRSGSNFTAGLTTTGDRIGSAVNAAFPASTALYGSVSDGPTMDSKIKRLITGDNRLWLAVSATAFPFGSVIDEAILVSGMFDYRIYGSIRKTHRSSAF
jgi:hypothetical protein